MKVLKTFRQRRRPRPQLAIGIITSNRLGGTELTDCVQYSRQRRLAGGLVLLIPRVKQIAGVADQSSRTVGSDCHRRNGSAATNQLSLTGIHAP
jgi:hypothetical protein